MGTQPPDFPDPSLYIESLSHGDAMRREAAAWSLGEIGSPRAARPLAGLLIRELKSVERTGTLANADVVGAVVEAIRRLEATECLYALIKALCTLSRAQWADEDLVVEIVESLGEVGGPIVVKEAADKVAYEARNVANPAPGLRIVGRVLLSRLSLCGDAALSTIRRLAHGGPADLKPIAEEVYAAL